jgi:hexulose-6-phosphate isomerase
MQGRLVPPVDGRIQCFPRSNWADEFELAARAGLNCIEWIYDEYGADANPIGSDQGIESMLERSESTGVQVVSMCADYFMDWPLIRASGEQLDERLAVLDWLMEQGKRLGIERIVLPFVDASRIETEGELQQVATSLGRALPRAEASNIELHLETSLEPDRFADLLARLPADRVKVNYDIGNSASLGYDPRQEFGAYGDRVGSVHIKDRQRGGGTVPLGDGDADIPAVFECLADRGYSGDYVLQVARDAPGDEVRWAIRNRSLTVGYLAGAAAGREV